MLSRIRTITGSRYAGASAVAYGLLVAGIAAVIVVVVFALGDTIAGTFGDDGCDPGSEASGASEDDCPPVDGEGRDDDG